MKKNIRKRIRITEEQQRHIEKQCETYGICESEFLRRLIDADIGNKVQYWSKEEYLAKKQLIYEVNKIGSNINQIVKNVNMHFYTDYEKKKLFAMIRKIIELLEDEKGAGKR